MNKPNTDEEHEIPCQDCGSVVWPDWYIPNEDFNKVCPGGNGYLCYPCFFTRAVNREKAALLDELEGIIDQNHNSSIGYDYVGVTVDLQEFIEQERTNLTKGEK